jgi:hypothetical protein
MLDHQPDRVLGSCPARRERAVRLVVPIRTLRSRRRGPGTQSRRALHLSPTGAR